ncbi:hypothetical protein C8Q77DRAFT_1131858 [Trametes polyzona]|nr:hypothetical protein C8Q77DRAFT_1131858 [Trametes polyzona]
MGGLELPVLRGLRRAAIWVPRARSFGGWRRFGSAQLVWICKSGSASWTGDA